MKIYNVLFLGLFCTVALSSMEDNLDVLKVIQERLDKQVQKLKLPERSKDDGVQEELQIVDGKVNVLKRIREDRKTKLRDAFETYNRQVKEAQERHQKRLNDKPGEYVCQKGEVSEDDEDYDDFDWNIYNLRELGKKQ